METIEASPKTKNHFRLKGSLFTLTVLQLLQNNSDDFVAELTKSIQSAPKFFENAPLVIDLASLPSQATVDFVLLKNQLSALNLIPIGIRGGTPEQQQQALQASFAVFPEAKSDTDINLAAYKKKSLQQKSATHTFHLQEQKATDITKSPSKIITTPVRSGQQIYAKGCDLIVLAPVSHGAELLADGHIHVYGPLRGRALAGVHGDTEAYIFCQQLEAELVSIAGYYCLKSEIEAKKINTSAIISLKDKELQINSI